MAAALATPATTATTVDGVQVTAQAVTLPGGASGTLTTIPIVTSGRVDATGNAATADIPLATDNGATVLLAQVGTGFGLTAFRRRHPDRRHLARAADRLDQGGHAGPHEQ